MGEVRAAAGVEFDASVEVLVIGAGAAGLVAALRAKEAGAEVLVLERDAVPRGSTALSAGLIPAAGTRFQHDASIVDSPERLAADIMAKSHGEADPEAVARVTRVIAPAVEWLAERHGLPFSVIDNFTYPGHSAFRMHGLPSRSGAELMDRLRAAAEAAGVDILTNAHVVALYADKNGRVAGVEAARPDGARERIGCGQLILACNGYGGDKTLVAEHVPEMSGALYFGHPGNQGDAVRWGRALGGVTRHLTAYQGHGSVAHPHGVLITWATITEGGFQVNLRGERFADESRGYSEQAADVAAQPEGLPSRSSTSMRRPSPGSSRISATPSRRARLSAPRRSMSCRTAEAASGGARILAASVREHKAAGGADAFGRSFRGVRQLAPPYRAVKVTGALFHTQGGLVVDGEARVVRAGGGVLPNLFAAGGAACGVSGSRASGYLSGNGLLTAVAYGYLAGHTAAGDKNDA